jgi:hypothetical protein
MTIRADGYDGGMRVLVRTWPNRTRMSDNGGKIDEGGETMWDALPDLSTLLAPLIVWLQGAIAVVGGIIGIWVIYDSWTNNPDRFSWFGALFKVIGVGIVVVILYNVPTIIAAFVA